MNEKTQGDIVCMCACEKVIEEMEPCNKMVGCTGKKPGNKNDGDDGAADVNLT